MNTHSDADILSCEHTGAVVATRAPARLFVDVPERRLCLACGLSDDQIAGLPQKLRARAARLPLPVRLVYLEEYYRLLQVAPLPEAEREIYLSTGQ